MTDTRKEFKKWWNIEKKNPIPDYGQESLTYDIAFNGWQACQSLNDKRIQQLLAVIAQKDALMNQCIENNLGLADGDICTLKPIKDAIAMATDSV